MMTIHYTQTKRPSQSRIAALYQSIIAARYRLTPDGNRADIIVVHHLPLHYDVSYEMNPRLRGKYVISCCISHAEEIPNSWRRGLATVQEVWTCSRYCHTVLSRYHPNVVYIPYVVERDLSCPQEASEFVRRLLGYTADRIYFLTLGSSQEPRKNIRGLVDAFGRIRHSIPDAVLVIKGHPGDKPTWEDNTQMLFLPMTLPHAYITALYQLVHVYVSAHHCEAWGLSISDAVLCGKPVIATGYSGNLDYLSESTAFLLPYRMDQISDADVGVGTTAGMAWATPEPHGIDAALLNVYNQCRLDRVKANTVEARESIKRFDREYAARCIYDRLDQIAEAHT